MIEKNPSVKKYIDIELIRSDNYNTKLEQVNFIEQGGFDHEDLSGMYTAFQNSSRYSSTRLCGWNNLLSFAFYHIQSQSELKEGVILDFLAGSGTLSKKVKQLVPNNFPTIIGLDVSKKMVERAQYYEEIVFWGSYAIHPFKNKIADVTIAAYGFHHVPLHQREDFLFSMQKTLKKNGMCILHDFEEGSATARWYSEIIHSYRFSGHPYKHVTTSGLQQLLKPYCKKVETKHIYDPFYLEGKKGQNEQSLRREFYAYLIGLFNLRKLLPDKVDIKGLNALEDQSYWRKIDKLFSSYFTLTDNEIKLIESQPVLQTIKKLECTTCIPVVNCLTIQQLHNNSLCLIAPRAALVGIGYKGGIDVNNFSNI